MKHVEKANINWNRYITVSKKNAATGWLHSLKNGFGISKP